MRKKIREILNKYNDHKGRNDKAESELLDLFVVSKRFYVAKSDDMKILSKEFDNIEDAERFIGVMKDGLNYRDTEMIILNVC